MPDPSTDMHNLTEDAYKQRHGWCSGKLNEVETKLMSGYSGYGTLRDAAVHAGISYGYAKQVISRPHIQAFLKSGVARNDYEAQLRAEDKIADSAEIQLYLTSVIRDVTKPDVSRSRAVELLAKMQGLLTDKVVHDISATVKASVKHADLTERLNLVQNPATPKEVAAIQDLAIEEWMK